MPLRDDLLNEIAPEIDDPTASEELEAVERIMGRHAHDEVESEVVEFELEIEEDEEAPKPKPQNKEHYIDQIFGRVDWQGIGHRVSSYRTVMGLTQHQLAERSGLDFGAIAAIESGEPRKNLNQIWLIVSCEALNIKWLFYGEGKFDDENDPAMLPETVVFDKGAGIRRSRERRAAEDGYYTDDPLDFVLAVDAYKRLNHVPFPTWTEVFEIVKALGYRKTAPPTINPRRGETLRKQGG
jgi:transcriptional regulator with XRE-family HTH domain